MSEKSKQQLVDDLRAKLDKDFGKGTIIGALDKGIPCEVQSTGSLKIDLALGVMGLPKGRIIEIYGPESSGKTTFCGEVIAQAHKENPNSYCAIVDAEHALDTNYFENLGVDLSRLFIAQPDYGEQALQIARKLIESGLYDVVVIDSVAALVTKAELEGEIGDSKMAPQARMMGQALRVLSGAVSKSNTILIFTNQIREKVGVMFGSPETTPGGNALKFFASVRIDIRRKTQNKDGEIVVGNTVGIKIAKNKVAPPFRTCEVSIVYGRGFDKMQEIVDLGVEFGIINKSGSWFSYGQDKLGQGSDNVKTLLEDNEELFEEIKTKILEKVKELS